MKIQPIVLDGIRCVRFLEEAFKAHNLTNHYSPGVHSGPGFKLSWTGSWYVDGPLLHMLFAHMLIVVVGLKPLPFSTTMNLLLRAMQFLKNEGRLHKSLLNLIWIQWKAFEFNQWCVKCFIQCKSAFLPC